MGSDLVHVAVDIETTGFDVADEVTVLGFEMPLGCRIFVQTGGQAGVEPDAGTGADTGSVTDTAATIEDAVRERTGHHVVVSTHASERELLVATWEFVGERLRDEDVLLVGYNAETWQGGFDLPFLRSRCATQDVPWLFGDLPYADLLPLVTDRFNTTVDGGDQVDLGGAYATLCDGDLNARDPFDDSQAAVDAFRDGEFVPLVTHNAVDICRTGAIGQVARQYCTKSDFSLKSLTPVIDDE